MLPKSSVGINSVPRILNQAKIFFPAEVSTAGCSDGETWRWVLCFFLNIVQIFWPLSKKMPGYVRQLFYAIKT